MQNHTHNPVPIIMEEKEYRKFVSNLSMTRYYGDLYCWDVSFPFFSYTFYRPHKLPVNFSSLQSQWDLSFNHNHLHFFQFISLDWRTTLLKMSYGWCKLLYTLIRRYSFFYLRYGTTYLGFEKFVVLLLNYISFAETLLPQYSRS